MAARGAGTAGRANAAHGHDTRELRANDPEAQARLSAFAQGMNQMGWTEGRDVQIDIQVWARQSHVTQARGGNSRACAGCDSCKWQRDDRSLAASDTHCADRVRDRPRSRRRSIRRELGSAGRQCHRLYPLRVRRRREMAGAAQGDHAEHDARGGYSRSAMASGLGQFAAIQAVAPSLGVDVTPVNTRDPRRDRARHRGLRALPPWGPDRDRECIGGSSSRSDHELAAQHKMPAIYNQRMFVEAGGLISYGPNFLDQSGVRLIMSIASLKARSPPTFRCSRRPSTSWSSTSRPRTPRVHSAALAPRPRRRGN